MTRIGGTVVIDLRIEDDDPIEDGHIVTRLIQSGAVAPTAADVVLWVDPRSWPPYLGLDYLREHGQHLGSITVQCSCPYTIKRWVDALRGEAA